MQYRRKTLHVGPRHIRQRCPSRVTAYGASRDDGEERTELCATHYKSSYSIHLLHAPYYGTKCRTRPKAFTSEKHFQRLFSDDTKGNVPVRSPRPSAFRTADRFLSVFINVYSKHVWTP